MTELQAAIVPKEETLPQPILWTSTLRRSKSLGSLSFKFPFVTNSNTPEDTQDTISVYDLEPASVLLPSISSLGLSFQADVNRRFHVHGFEELKRCRGTCSSQLSSTSEVNCTGYAVIEQDEETRGAASALMELFTQNAPSSPIRSQTAANVLLPTLSKIVSTSAASVCSSSPSGQNLFLVLNRNSHKPLSSDFEIAGGDSQMMEVAKQNILKPNTFAVRRGIWP